MSDQFELSSSPNHVGIDYTQAVRDTLAEFKASAAAQSVAAGAAYEPEVAFFQGLIADLQRELPAAMREAGWPAALQSGDKLDDFILQTLKDLAVDARGRGTRASAKQAVVLLELS